MNINILRERAGIIMQVRAFFDNKGYLSVDTPLLQPDLIPESCLEVFKTTRLFPHGSREKSRPMYLIPSPEISMKKLIAQHKVNMYQICKCFRNGESVGHLHNSEFTMLEYYAMGVNYLEALKITEELFNFLINIKGLGTGDWGLGSCTNVDLETPSYDSEQKQLLTAHCSLLPFKRLTVAQAFERYANFDLFEAVSKPSLLEKHAHRLGLAPPVGTPIPALYDLIFIHAVEPHLKTDKPVALLDYPAFVPCLAKKSQDGKTVERWELYWNGVELANCFTEETDPQKVKEFFTNEAAEKEKSALVKHGIDHDYYKIFEDFPECSGVAMGLDRLIMALTGKSSIDAVLP